MDEPTLAGEVLREIERDTERVVEAEHRVARHDRSAGRLDAVQQFLEAGQPAREHRIEPVLLGADGTNDRVALADELRIARAHLAHDDVDECVQERLAETELLPVTHRSPHDLAQHVATPLVRRQDAVRDEERHRPQMIGHDPHRDVRVVERSRRAGVGAAGAIRDRPQDRLEKVRLVGRQLALNDRRDPLEAHARVDRLRGQRRQRAAFAAIELHEHVVPDLDVPFAVALDALCRPARSQGMWLPRKYMISEQRPQGPVSPICQKLSARPSSVMRDARHERRPQRRTPRRRAECRPRP